MLSFCFSGRAGFGTALLTGPVFGRLFAVERAGVDGFLFRDLGLDPSDMAGDDLPLDGEPV